MNYRYITTISITIIGLVSGIIGTKTHFFNKFTGAVTPVKQDPEKITGLLVAKGYAPTQQLITRLREKNRELEKELEALTAENEHVQIALETFKANDYEKARELFETLRQEEKEQGRELAGTAYNLGNVYFVELKFSEALHAYLKAVELAPDNSTYLNNTSNLLSILAQHDRAIEYYERALMADFNALGGDGLIDPKEIVKKHPYAKTVKDNSNLAKKIKK